MKKILIIGIATACINSSFAKDADLRPYVGGNINYNFVSFSSTVEDMMSYYDVSLSEGYFGVGLEGGIKFGNIKNTWNGGILFAYDYLFDSSASVYDLYIDDVKTGFSAWNVGFDNYIKLDEENNNRYDLILGLGFGQATERIKISGTGLTENYSDDGGVFVLKLGTNIQINEKLDWYASIRGFIPTKSGDVEHIISMQTGIKFNF